MGESRGARIRRGGRTPGWRLLSALLVLAVVASSTLVFTNRVELLRLAVVVSLWAVVLAAFASLTYRRQGELGEVRARDLKLVYDLQLDREIAARREYELSVEAYLRRQLSWELRAEAADEMAALRAELASLRSSLEAVIGAEFADRPALGAERATRAVAAPPGKVQSSRVSAGEPADTLERPRGGIDPEDTAEFETPIIDVPEEPLAPPPPPVRPPEPPPMPPPAPEPDPYRGSHRRPDRADDDDRPGVRPEPMPPRGRHRVAAEDESSERSAPPPWSPPPWSPPPWEPPQPPARDDAEEEQSQGQHTGGHSVADLLARLQVNPSSGGGRRRRDG